MVEPKLITISSVVAAARGTVDAANFVPGEGQADQFLYARINGVADTLQPRGVLWARAPQKHAFLMWDGFQLVMSLRDAANAHLPRDTEITFGVLTSQSKVPITLSTVNYAPWRSIPIDAAGANPASQRNSQYNADLRVPIGFNAIFDEEDRILVSVRSSVALVWTAADSYLEFKVQEINRADLGRIAIPNSKLAREA